MSKFAILLGGPITATPRLRAQVADARIIAADGGMEHAGTLELEPELWLGDFDSASKHLLRQYDAVPRQSFPEDKGASDGELAISEALRRGATSLVLVGGMGGQLDHVLAHAGFVIALAKRGVDIFMTSGAEEAHGLVDQVALNDLTTGTRLSILPFTDLVGLTISGVKWPLNKKSVKLGSALTLSNVVMGKVEATLQFGQALIIVYPHGSV